MTDTPFKVGQTYRTHLKGNRSGKLEWTDGTHALLRESEDCVTLLMVRDLLPPDPPKPARVRRWFFVDRQIGWSIMEMEKGMVPIILTIPADIAAQCDWLKDAEIVHDD